MRIKTLTVMALIWMGLSGCSLWTKSDKTDTMSQSDTILRQSPQQAYQFDNQTYDVDVYDTASASQYTGYSQYAGQSQYTGQSQYAGQSQYTGQSQYMGYVVELYSTAPSYSAVTYSDPRQSEFVMLNGESDPLDWQNCETLNRGYLFISEYDFSLNPDFEVCMRNKGYVLTTEYNLASKQALSAQTAGLRGGYRFSALTPAQSSYFP